MAEQYQNEIPLIGPASGSLATHPSPSPLLDRASLDWLRLVVDSMSEGFALLSPEFTILDLNQEAIRIDGRPRQDIIGRAHWTVYPGSEDSEIGRLYKKAMSERVPVALEHRYEWADGRESWFETRAYPVPNGCLAIFYRDVTQRHQANQRLHASEQRFKAAVSAVEGVVWTNNADGEMVGEQPGWAALTGQSFEHYRGYGWSRAIHPEDAQPTIDAWQAAVVNCTPFAFEHRVRRHDGVWRLCAIRAIPVLDDSGRITEWVGVHRDITDARANELRLHQLAEAIDEVFYVREVDAGKISYVSPAYERLWGRPRQELYDDPNSAMALLHPDDRDIALQAVARRAAGHNTDTEYRLQRPDGVELIIHDRAFVTRDPVTNARRIVGLATDITQYRRAQDRLARNAETFTHLVVSNPFGIYVVDADFKLVEMSKGTQAVFAGIDQVIGRDIAEILHLIWADPFASAVIDHFRHTLATGESYVSPTTIEQRANVDKVEAYDWRIDRIVLPDGRYGVVCYFYDLSERNAYEAKLTQALADKELLTREIDHRVKNSLAVVASLLSMQRRASTSPETRAALDEAADRVMAVARVHETLHKSDRLGIIALGEYLENICQNLKNSVDESGPTIDCSIADVDVPAEAAMPIALITNELVANAIKHGIAAGATNITITLTCCENSLTLTVTDNGAGMPPAKRSNSASLGLKLVQALTRQLNAQLTVPAAGMPAIFSVEIPNLLNSQ